MVSMRFILTLTLMLSSILILGLGLRTANAQSDPYLIWGYVNYNNKALDNVKVTITYDRLGTSFENTSDKNGVYAIQLGNYQEGDTYTVKAYYNGYEFIDTGKIVKYDSQGYIRQGDQIDINFTKKEQHDNHSFLVLIIGALLSPIIYVAYKDKRGDKERKEH